MSWEPEVVDWDAEGVCSYVITYGAREGEEMCGRSFDDRPTSGCIRKGEHRCNARHGGAVVRCDLRKGDCQRLAQHEREERLGVRPDAVKLTALDVEKAIRERHRNRPGQDPEWMVMTEVDLGGRRVDVMALRLWTSRGVNLHAYEVKVDATDLRNELKTPAKRRPAMECSTQFWFATPVGLMDVQKVPDGCGLIEVGRQPKGSRSTRKYQTAAVVDAPIRRIDCINPRLLFTIAWRLRDLQHTLRSRGISA